MNERSLYLIVALVGGVAVPAATALTQTSWWMWLGGGLGILYVSSSIFATPRIGAALMLALAIAVQLLPCSISHP